MASKNLYEISTAEFNKLLKGTKIVPNEISTGISYFEGKDRIIKILKTKKSSKIEINIILPTEIETKFNLKKISAQTAYKKHLGTLKYYANINSETELKKLLKIIISEYKNSKNKNLEISSK